MSPQLPERPDRCSGSPAQQVLQPPAWFFAFQRAGKLVVAASLRSPMRSRARGQGASGQGPRPRSGRQASRLDRHSVCNHSPVGLGGGLEVSVGDQLCALRAFPSTRIKLPQGFGAPSPGGDGALQAARGLRLPRLATVNVLIGGCWPGRVVSFWTARETERPSRRRGRRSES